MRKKPKRPPKPKLPSQSVAPEEPKEQTANQQPKPLVPDHAAVAVPVRGRKVKQSGFGMWLSLVFVPAACLGVFTVYFSRPTPRRDPKADNLYVKGSELATAGKLREAIAVFEEAIRVNPELADAFYAKAMQHSALADHAGAADALRSFLELRPESADAWLALGNELAMLGRKTEASKAYRMALDHNPSLAQARAALRALE
jgi:tetratricopeptide (TPR) repeat protein